MYIKLRNLLKIDRQYAKIIVNIVLMYSMRRVANGILRI